MSYDEFINQFTEIFERIMEERGFRLEQKAILKNNGQYKDALLIKSNNSNIAPTVYLEDCYHDYLMGNNLEQVVKATEAMVIGNMQSTFSLPPINNKTAKENLYITIVNAAANKELLKNTPHRIIEDLAIIPRFRVNMGGDTGSFVVHDNVLPTLKMTKDEVLNLAIKNTEEQGFKLSTMQEMLGDIVSEGFDLENDEMFEELFPVEEPMLYVLTNSNKTQGAAVLGCKNALNAAINQIGEECYILPASCHEVLLIKKSQVNDVEDLKEMVREVNQTQVSPQDFLSNSVYSVHPQTKQLMICNGDVGKEIGTPKKAKCLCM